MHFADCEGLPRHEHPAPPPNTPLAPRYTPGNSTSEPRLLDQVRARIRLRYYSIRTETQYVQRVRRFVVFHRERHPREMGAAEVEAFLRHLAVEEHVA